MAKRRTKVTQEGSAKRSKFERLVEAGVIPTPEPYSPTQRATIEEVLSEADVDALVRVKLNLGPEFAGKDLGGGPGQLIIF